MKNSFNDILSSKSWLIKEKNWDPKIQQIRETQFTLGNGNICCRGILEELPYDALAGTYIGGIYDRTGAQITELVNLPNPLLFRIDAYGEKLDPIAMDIISHERILDLKKGTLFRNTVYKTTHNKRIDYKSKRFVSLHNKNLIVMEIEVKPLDADMTINVQTMIDTGVFNGGTITEGRKRHFQPVEVKSEKGLSYICVETFEKKILVSYASALKIYHKNMHRLVSDRAMNIKVKKGEIVIFKKIIAVDSSKKIKSSELRKSTLKILKTAQSKGIEKLEEDHILAWAKKWSIADINIEGDSEATKALRFNTFHLMIAGSENNSDVSIGAKTLSGEGYRGHIFWDTELFILPFFIYTNPTVAKNLLLYRYNRLNAARNNSFAKGYKGALFPWESADTGEECTPSWAKNFDGSIIKIVTMDQEHHIVADIAYAFVHYCEVTNDKTFQWKYAFEVLLETARFWASRVVFNNKKNRYEILHVMGPDELHEDVNNNAYTNMMAAWNLKKACEWFSIAKKEKSQYFTKLVKKLKIDNKKINKWKKISEKIYIPYLKKKNFIYPFDGFLSLKEHRITQLDAHLMPCLPSSVKWTEIGKTQLIKQADVVMLLYLFSEKFSLLEKKKNYYFNERRTLHKSSLSPAIHSIVGLEVGDEDKALHYFSHALSTDLSNIHGNTAHGIHAASAGGAWQAAIMGFAGLRRKGENLSFTPHIQQHWKGIDFCIIWQKCRIKVSMSHTKTDITLLDKPKKGKIMVEVYGILKELLTHKSVKFSP